MSNNRIFFKSNPWPEGHPIGEFAWSAFIKDEDVWFNLHIKTDSYYSERTIAYDAQADYPSDWECPGVWGNFQRCILSSSHWNNGGFKACSIKEYSLNHLDNLEIEVDAHPEKMMDLDALAFGIYLLGHDAAAKHKIKFERLDNSNLFNITWTGMIALAYVGDYDFKHSFLAQIECAQFPELASIA